MRSIIASPDIITKSMLWDKTQSHLVFWPQAFARTLCVMKPRRAVDVLMPVKLKRESQTSSNWAKYNCFSEHTLNIGNVWKTVKCVEPSGNFNSGKNKSTLSNLCKLLGGTYLTPHHKHFKHLSFHKFFFSCGFTYKFLTERYDMRGELWCKCGTESVNTSSKTESTLFYF